MKKKLIVISIIFIVLTTSLLFLESDTQTIYNQEDIFSKNFYYRECLSFADETSTTFEEVSRDRNRIITKTVKSINEYEEISRLHICTKDSYQIIEAITISSFINDFAFDDINDDGFIDIVILDWNRSGASNYHLNIWLYDEEANRFRYSKLSDIRSPQFVDDSNLVYSTWTFTYRAGGFTLYRIDGEEFTAIRDVYTLYPEYIGEEEYQNLYAIDYIEGVANSFYCTFALYDDENPNLYSPIHSNWADPDYIPFDFNSPTSEEMDCIERFIPGFDNRKYFEEKFGEYPFTNNYESIFHFQQLLADFLYGSKEIIYENSQLTYDEFIGLVGEFKPSFISKIATTSKYPIYMVVFSSTDAPVSRQFAFTTDGEKLFVEHLSERGIKELKYNGYSKYSNSALESGYHFYSVVEGMLLRRELSSTVITDKGTTYKILGKEVTEDEYKLLEEMINEIPSVGFTKIDKEFKEKYGY